MSDDMEDITPADSVAPIHFDTTPCEPSNLPPMSDLIAELGRVQVAREAGINRLVQLGLTREQAEAVAGP